MELGTIVIVIFILILVLLVPVNGSNIHINEKPKGARPKNPPSPQLSKDQRNNGNNI